MKPVHLRAWSVCMLAALAACGRDVPPPALETVATGEVLLSVSGQGELRSAKATPLLVPGSQWAERRLVWMLAEGSVVGKGDLLARFSAEQGELDLAQALLDLQRNALARAAKEGELDAGQGRVAVDLSQVGVQLGIAQRYADADMDAMARNQVLDAVQDVRYLGAKRDTLQWRQGQFERRGGAELAVLDAQRATIDLNAGNRRGDLEALELRAPHAGVLMLSANWSGEKPGVGSTLRAGFEFGSLPDTGAMEVELSLPQMQAQGVRVGNVVELFPPGRPDQKLVTELSWVAGAAKVASRQSPVKYLSMKAPIPDAVFRRHGWVPGQMLEARVILLRAAEGLSVANVALRSEAGRHYVQVRDGARFERREVRLGVRGSARSQVVGGLRAGEQVLLVAAEDADDEDGQDNGTTGPGAGPPPTGDTQAEQGDDQAGGA